MPHFPQLLRNLPAFEGPFDAFKLEAKDCDVLFASYPRGTVIPPHDHETENVGVITQGELILIVDGKPYTWATIPAFFPIIFELTVLFSAFSTVFSLLIMNQLPKWYHPVFNWERFSRVTDDGFFIVIEARDAKFSETKTRALLEEIGGQHVTLIHD